MCFDLFGIYLVDYLFIYYSYLVTFNGLLTLAFEHLCLPVWPGMRERGSWHSDRDMTKNTYRLLAIMSAWTVILMATRKKKGQLLLYNLHLGPVVYQDHSLCNVIVSLTSRGHSSTSLYYNLPYCYYGFLVLYQLYHGLAIMLSYHDVVSRLY